MITIRPEQLLDNAKVFELNKLAFGGYEEANIVESLRSVAGTISLVAEEDETILGHICFSLVTLNSDAGTFTALGPMCVMPDRQRQGIGSRLVEAGLAACRENGVTAVFVLGHAEYYPRFGFRNAADFGIACEYDVPAENFMALELVPGALRDVHGVISYDRAFSES